MLRRQLSQSQRASWLLVSPLAIMMRTQYSGTLSERMGTSKKYQPRHATKSKRQLRPPHSPQLNRILVIIVAALMGSVLGVGYFSSKGRESAKGAPRSMSKIYFDNQAYEAKHNK